MAKAFVDIEATGEAASLGHAEWLALLLEREASLRHNKRLATRLLDAKSCASRRMLKTSTTTSRSTARCSPNLSRPLDRRPNQPVDLRTGRRRQELAPPRRSATRPAATIAASSTSASRAC
ncbi:hypothetical protein J2R78_001550 [Bradyrhizobium sp. USDA 4538]|nr:hypothetical protein [Bradyrhizobium sp. USDA 4538]MCP1899148.1 hypothetical protein [Bradyrhizobium sp. USDA 4537]MCP1986739.1 hypothetical protein [Bradyrhizobium sp. USDA 4539]